jgi:hypothetical protein
MSFVGARNLWELLGLAKQPAPVEAPAPPADPPERPEPARKGGAPRMQDRYDALVDEMKERYGVRVRKWRRSSSGVAWIVRYDDGREARLIEAPYPRGPMSCAIFLHEIGHHAIGFETYKPRCLEEYHAWKWALEFMRERRLNVTGAVEKRARDSVRWAIRKARRRGLRELPAELLPYR